MIGVWFQINKNPCKECILKTICNKDLCCDIYRAYDSNKERKIGIAKSIILTSMMLIMNVIGVILFLR